MEKQEKVHSKEQLPLEEEKPKKQSIIPITRKSEIPKKKVLTENDFEQKLPETVEDVLNDMK